MYVSHIYGNNLLMSTIYLIRFNLCEANFWLSLRMLLREFLYTELRKLVKNQMLPRNLFQFILLHYLFRHFDLQLVVSKYAFTQYSCFSHFFLLHFNSLNSDEYFSFKFFRVGQAMLVFFSPKNIHTK